MSVAEVWARAIAGAGSGMWPPPLRYQRHRAPPELPERPCERPDQLSSLPRRPALCGTRQGEKVVRLAWQYIIGLFPPRPVGLTRGKWRVRAPAGSIGGGEQGRIIAEHLGEHVLQH